MIRVPGNYFARVVWDEIVSTGSSSTILGRGARAVADRICLGDGGRIQGKWGLSALCDHPAEGTVPPNQRGKWESLRYCDNVAHPPPVGQFGGKPIGFKVRDVVQHTHVHRMRYVSAGRALVQLQIIGNGSTGGPRRAVPATAVVDLVSGGIERWASNIGVRENQVVA